MKFFQLSIVALLFVACTQKANTDTSSDCIAKLDEDCICTAHYDPVCGCDGVTYGNACEASCNNVKYTKGECPDR